MSDANNRINYSGRTVDLLLLKTVLKVPVSNHRVRIDADGTPMIVSGVEKMVQRYALAFINAIGSTKFRPGHGTYLIPDVAEGRVYDMSTLTATASEANFMARDQIVKADSEESDTPDDERLVDSEVYDLKMSVDRSSVDVSVRLTSAAGDEYVYIIPVAIGVH